MDPDPAASASLSAATRAAIDSGTRLLAQSRPGAALDAFLDAVRASPGSAEALHGAGLALAALGRQDEAIERFREALVHASRHANTLYNLGNSLAALGRHVEALAAYDAAIESKPGLAAAHLNRGGTLLELDAPDRAIDSLREAVRVSGGSAVALHGLGTLLRLRGRLDEAITALDAAVNRDPMLPYVRGDRLFAKLATCQWQGVNDEIAGVLSDLRQGRRVIEPLACATVSADAEDQLRCARQRFADYRRPDLQSDLSVAVEPPPAYRHGRVRVAYLSRDFREGHPVGRIIVPIIECHDRQRLEVIGLSFGKVSDGAPLDARMHRACDRYLDVSRHGDAQLVRLMRELEVDIAVDLMGHTLHARPRIFAQRAAALQVNYLGYPGTMGHPSWDYIIADDTIAPPGVEHHYSEQIVRLPHCYLAVAREGDTRPRMSRAAAGLPDGAFVFLAPNACHKLTPQVFGVWMRLLREIDHSVLWLTNGDETTASRLRQSGKEHGVDPERLIIAGRTPALADHLDRIRVADLALDTLPYNGHVTTCDALCAGVPVLTCLGTTFAGRVCASVLRAAGLNELITHSLQDYEAKALQLAGSTALLGQLRKRLQVAQSMPLFDVQQFTHGLDEAYLRMSQRLLDGLPAQSFDID